MNQTISVILLPTLVMYLIMFLGFLRYWMLRRKKGPSATLKAVDPVEMNFAALILDVVGIANLYSGLQGRSYLTEKSVAVLPVVVGVLLFIIHLQLYAYVLRRRLDELDIDAESRRYRLRSLDLMLSILAVLSNAMTVLAVLG